MYTKLPQMKTDRLKRLNLHSKRFKAKYAALFDQLAYIISSHPTHDVHFQM